MSITNDQVEFEVRDDSIKLAQKVTNDARLLAIKEAEYDAQQQSMQVAPAIIEVINQPVKAEVNDAPVKNTPKAKESEVYRRVNVTASECFRGTTLRELVYSSLYDLYIACESQTELGENVRNAILDAAEVHGWDFIPSDNWIKYYNRGAMQYKRRREVSGIYTNDTQSDELLDSLLTRGESNDGNYKYNRYKAVNKNSIESIVIMSECSAELIDVLSECSDTMKCDILASANSRNGCKRVKQYIARVDYKLPTCKAVASDYKNAAK